MTEQSTLGTTTARRSSTTGAFGTREIVFSTGRLARRPPVRPWPSSATPSSCRPPRPSKQPKEQFDFFPLTVDVEERMYAAGRIPGSFFRREGRPSEDAILTCRLIDRPLRPSFVKGLRNEVQVVETVLALDPQHPYDVVAINAASLSTKLVRPAVLRPDRRDPDGPRRRHLGRLPDPRGAGAGDLRHGRRRPGAARRRRRDHDGRGRGHRQHDQAGRRGRAEADRGGRRRRSGGRQAGHP